MDGQSKNLTQEYIKQLQAIFPEAVIEVADKYGNNTSLKVDMEKLSILLGEASIPEDDTYYKQKYGEKFSFEWAGKRRAIAEAQKRSTGTLRPCPEESEDWGNTENLYIEGDNLEVLKLLQDAYIGAIKMIYIDPPYNTGKDFVYKDNYRDNLSNYLEQTNTTNAVNSEASGRYHTNWLNMMYPRLKLARNLLTDDGVIFISIDDNEVSNLKTICDEIFGEDNFLRCIANINNPKGRSDEQNFATSHEYILVYQKMKTSLKGFSPEDNVLRRYNKIDEKNRLYRHIDLRKTGDSDRRIDRPNMFYFFMYNQSTGDFYPTNTIEDIDGYISIAPKKDDETDGRWRVGIETAKERLQNLVPYYMVVKKRWTVMEKDYLSDDMYIKSTSSWSYKDVNSERGTEQFIDLGFDKNVFPRPKPIGTIKRTLLLSTFSDEIILDFFSGSATTAHAVMELNAEDGGSRKYICVQLPEKTPDNSEAQKAGYKTITEIAKERIRRAGKKILEEQKNKEQGDLFTEPVKKLDIGFKVFKLDRSNVADWDLELNGTNEKEAQEKLIFEFNKVLNILKEGRTELDLLYEVMLKLGLQLTTKVEVKEINGKKVFIVGYGVMVASFAKELTYSDITRMLEYKADYVQTGEFKVVLSDESFASNNDKVNVMQLFKQKGITNFEII